MKEASKSYVFQLLRPPAIDIIFYLFKRCKAFESANVTNLILTIPYRCSQVVELESCWTYNFLKIYVQFLLIFVYPYILKLLKVPY